MPIHYNLEDRKFSMSYTELREEYMRVIDMTDKEFMDNLPKILHVACIICFFKEIPTYECLSDVGIIHEIAHIMEDNNPVHSLKHIRNKFKDQLELV